MICFQDEELDKWARKLAWLGISTDTYARFNKNAGSYKWRYDVPDVGFKYHGNSIIASIGLVQLKYLDEDNGRRNEIAETYNTLLRDSTHIHPIPIAPDCQSARHLYQIVVENRDELLQKFYDNDIFPGVHYWDNTNYQMYSYAKGSCPNAEDASRKIISLPLHLNLSSEDIHSVADILK
jgi:dTDP-4-amino-4,6-dideoxygalactose transaminase